MKTVPKNVIEKCTTQAGSYSPLGGWPNGDQGGTHGHRDVAPGPEKPLQPSSSIVKPAPKWKLIYRVFQNSIEVKNGELRGLQGTIPQIAYSEKWTGGHATLSANVTVAPMAPGAGALPSDEAWITVQVTAKWSNAGLMYGKPTGIEINGCGIESGRGHVVKDFRDKFINGETSANVTWTGPIGCFYTPGFNGVVIAGKINMGVSFEFEKE